MASCDGSDVILDKPRECGSILSRASSFLNQLATIYHEKLRSSTEFTIPSLEKFQNQLALSILDLCRVAITEHLGAMGDGTIGNTIYDAVYKLEAGPESGRFVQNAYRKNTKIARWMIDLFIYFTGQIDEILINCQN